MPIKSPHQRNQGAAATNPSRLGDGCHRRGLRHKRFHRTLPLASSSWPDPGRSGARCTPCAHRWEARGRTPSATTESPLNQGAGWRQSSVQSSDASPADRHRMVTRPSTSDTRAVVPPISRATATVPSSELGLRSGPTAWITCSSAASQSSSSPRTGRRRSPPTADPWPVGGLPSRQRWPGTGSAGRSGQGAHRSCPRKRRR